MRNRYSVQNRLRRLVTANSVLLAVISLSSLIMLIFSNKCYAQMLHNVSTASEFNQEFKNNIDQKMYYYVIESKYSEGLPIQEVQAAKELAKSLSLTTTQKESRQAITSVLDLCNNLEQHLIFNICSSIILSIGIIFMMFFVSPEMSWVYFGFLVNNLKRSTN